MKMAAGTAEKSAAQLAGRKDDEKVEQSAV